MSINRTKLVNLAETAERESRLLDFKREFGLSSAAAWCELIKDIVAFANSGGGVIIFGVENEGKASGINCNALLTYDLANITNKVFSYSGVQFADLEVIEVERSDGKRPAILISSIEIPIVFTKPGTYDVGDGKQKTAFSQGTIYFRHGAKSEPGNSADLGKWRDRELTAHRKSLLTGVKKVVAAPPGTSFSVITGAESASSGSQRVAAQITFDPKGKKIAIHNTDELFPYRQKELLALVNTRLPKGIKISGHDIRCVNKQIDALKKHPEFIHKPHKLASPQYSDAFIDWLVAQSKADRTFFATCRANFQP
jgi:hypothetical protein